MSYPTWTRAVKNSPDLGKNVTRAAVLRERRSRELRLLRRHRLAELLWKLGPHPLSEFVDELDRNYDIPGLDRRLERYAELDAHTLSLLGADKLPAAPLHEVRR